MPTNGKAQALKLGECRSFFLGLVHCITTPKAVGTCTANAEQGMDPGPNLEEFPIRIFRIRAVDRGNPSPLFLAQSPRRHWRDGGPRQSRQSAHSASK